MLCSAVGPDPQILSPEPYALSTKREANAPSFVSRFTNRGSMASDYTEGSGTRNKKAKSIGLPLMAEERRARERGGVGCWGARWSERE